MPTINIANSIFGDASNGTIGFFEAVSDSAVLANYADEKTLVEHLNYFRDNGTFTSLRQANDGDLVIVVLKQSQILPDSGQTFASCGAAFNPSQISVLNRTSGILVVGDNCNSFIVSHEIGHTFSMNHHWKHVCEDVTDSGGSNPSTEANLGRPSNDNFGFVSNSLQTQMSQCGRGIGGTGPFPIGRFSRAGAVINLGGVDRPIGTAGGTTNDQGQQIGADNADIVISAGITISLYHSPPPPGPAAFDTNFMGCHGGGCARWLFSYSASKATQYRIESRPPLGFWSHVTTRTQTFYSPHLGNNAKHWRVRGENGSGAGAWDYSYTEARCGGEDDINNRLHIDHDHDFDSSFVYDRR